MNLVVEAGGTKTHLVLIGSDGSINHVEYRGVNYARESPDSFGQVLRDWKSIVQEPINNLYYFGAGILGDQIKSEVANQVSEKLKIRGKIHVESDLLASCYATTATKPGIVGILGTGSNSCFFDGEQIMHQNNSGGFLLGDEGSGSFMGKSLLKDCIRKNIPDEIYSLLQQDFNLTDQTIIKNLYGGTIHQAVGYCASFVPFIKKHLEMAYMNNLVNDCLALYLSLLKSSYHQFSSNVYLTGSVADVFKENINTVAKKFDLKICQIIKHPIKPLTKYLIENSKL